jgi:hypothetical protein
VRGVTAEGSEQTALPAGDDATPHRMTRRPPVPAAHDDPGRRWRALPSGFASIRDLLSFGAGVAIIAHEVWWSKRVDVAILAVGATLAGLPVVFGADEKKAKLGGGGKDE